MNYDGLPPLFCKFQNDDSVLRSKKIRGQHESQIEITMLASLTDNRTPLLLLLSINIRRAIREYAMFIINRIIDIVGGSSITRPL